MIHWIASISTAKAKYTLWQRGDYHYQIDVQKRKVARSVDLHCSYEEAMEVFGEMSTEILK